MGTKMYLSMMGLNTAHMAGATITSFYPPKHGVLSLATHLNYLISFRISPMNVLSWSTFGKVQRTFKRRLFMSFEVADILYVVYACGRSSHAMRR